jgi:hypothetical protein
LSRGHATAPDDAAKVIERFDLNLANAFAGQIQVEGDFLEGAGLAAAKTVTTLQHLLLFVGRAAPPTGSASHPIRCTATAHRDRSGYRRR